MQQRIARTNRVVHDSVLRRSRMNPLTIFAYRDRFVYCNWVSYFMPLALTDFGIMGATTEGWAMQKKYVVRLTTEERSTLEHVVRKLKGSSQKVRRANIHLKADADGIRLDGRPNCRGLRLPPANRGGPAGATGDRRVRARRKRPSLERPPEGPRWDSRGEDHRPPVGAAAGRLCELVTAPAGRPGRGGADRAVRQSRDGAADAQKKA